MTETFLPLALVDLAQSGDAQSWAIDPTKLSEFTKR